MVAYSFQKRFAAPILAGTKAQTIRADRKRHARPGEQLQLYTGMRTKQCRKLGEPTCTSIHPVRLRFDAHGSIEAVLLDGAYLLAPAMQRFAQADGFASIADMAAFWVRAHTWIDEFRGWLIRWTPLAPVDALLEGPSR